ncbi:hypothetical protein BJX99DRAFT_230433 [Aspergillus californicus]
MANKVLSLLAIGWIIVTVFAMETGGSLDAELDGFDVDDIMNYYEHKLHEARALADPNIVPRAETVTVTKTVCAPDGPVPTEASPIISIPETTLATSTLAPAPIPTAALPQPSVSSVTGSSPSGAELTTASAPLSSSDGETTIFQTSSSSSSSSADGTASSTEAATETTTRSSTSPTDTATPTANAGFARGGMSSAVLAITLIFACLFGF